MRSLPKLSPLLSSAVALTLVLGAATEASAAAWYLGEISTRALGRGGANIVNPGDPTAMWLNPAAITNSTGLQLHLEGAFVFMDASFVRDCGPRNDCGPIDVNRDYGEGRKYVVDGDGRILDPENDFYPAQKQFIGLPGKPSAPDGHAVRNEAPFQAIPGIWATLNLDSFGLDGIAVGASVFAPRAGDYAFGDEEYTRYTLIDRDLIELYYGITAAYRFQNWIAIGASVQGVSAGVDQRIKMSADLYGSEVPTSDIGVHISTMTHFIPSANFGLWSSPLPGLELGASVQLGRSVQAKGPLKLESFGPAVQKLIDAETVKIVEDNPQALTAFELPPVYRAGIKYGMRDLFDGLFGFELELDFVYEQWSTYDHVFIETSGIAMQIGPNDARPLDPIIQPKDWMDAWSVRLGGEVWFLDEMFALRSGLYYETDAIPNETYAVDLMNGQQVGVGVGGSVKLWGVRLDVGYGHMFLFDRVIGDESIVHAETIKQPGGHTEPRTRIAMGRYSTSYNVLSVAVNIAFDDMFGFGVYNKRDDELARLSPPEDSPAEGSFPGEAEGGERAPAAEDDGADPSRYQS